MIASYSKELTRHEDAIGKVVARVGDQNNQTTLDLGHLTYECVLQQESRGYPNRDPDQKTTDKDQEEEADSFKETHDGEGTSLRSVWPILLGCVVYHDSDCIVKDRFPEDDGIQFRVHFVGIEDCEDRNRVGGGECCSNRDCLDERDLEAIERDACPQPEKQS